MDATKIKSALADITAGQDPTFKSAKLAPLCGTLWAERGVELVVAGNSAMQILTESESPPAILTIFNKSLAFLRGYKQGCILLPMVPVC